jgi:hypothetical protein
MAQPAWTKWNQVRKELIAMWQIINAVTPVFNKSNYLLPG